MLYRQPKLITILIVLILLVSQSAQAQDELSPYEIALQRIEEARLSGATELNLGGLRLTELPPEIWRLTYLTRISFKKEQVVVQLKGQFLAQSV